MPPTLVTLQMIGRMRDAIARRQEVGNDPDASCSTNRELHLALAAASANPHLKRFVEMLWMPGIGVTDDEIPTGQASHEVLSPAGDHERILDAVCAGDATLAEHLTRSHVAAYPALAAGAGPSARICRGALVVSVA